MNSPTPSVPDTFKALVAWIEQQLDQPLTLDRIAARAGLSPYHFSRLFTAHMGRSAMAHVRGRRLVYGARRLCREPHLALIDLAFDCGFESQEAFSRAFKRLFGISPGRFRSRYAIEPLESPAAMHLPSSPIPLVVALPDRVALPAFRVAGPQRHFDDTSKAEIPRMWPALIGALPLAGQVEGWTTYGVLSCFDQTEGSFQYMAGVGVGPGCAPPPGFSALDIPAATYAVFRITLDGTALHPQVKQAMASIWGELVPALGLKPAAGPHFECYDGRFDPQKPGSCIDFHIPLEH